MAPDPRVRGGASKPSGGLEGAERPGGERTAVLASATHELEEAERVAAKYDALIASEPRTTRILAGADAASVEEVTADEFARYEALSHAIITEHGATVVCLYDASSLPADFVDVSARRHPLAVEDGAVRRNERFEYQPV